MDLRFANLDAADRAGASLAGADLTSIDLDHAGLSLVDFVGAVLAGATLRSADLTGAQLGGADLTGARLTNAVGLSLVFGQALYSAQTDFTGTSFDLAAAGWSLVPEPEARWLVALGFGWLLGLRGRR